MQAQCFCPSCHQVNAQASAICVHCGQGLLVAERWRLLSLLGEGASGCTWKGDDLETQDVVALKELTFRKMSTFKSLDLFERETQVLSSLDHPGIPKFIGQSSIESASSLSFFLVQELIDGSVLQLGGTDERTVLEMIVELCEILAYLHARRPPVIHRDIKPSNIMRRVDGGLVLIDFGSVRQLVRDARKGGSTVAGTFGYMAPEQLRGLASPASDLYALAATALACLAGRDAAELLDPIRPSEWRAQVTVSDGMARLLQMCLQPRHQTRLGDAALLGLKAKLLLQQSLPPRRREPRRVVGHAPEGRSAEASAEALHSTERASVLSSWCWIPPGHFLMGSAQTEQQRDDDEHPHEVELSRGFHMKATLVTQLEWQHLMGNNPSHFGRSGLLAPVENVSWFDAIAYCNALSLEEGFEPVYAYGGMDGVPGEAGFCLYELRWREEANGFRLPTEAEWEFACRAASAGPYFCEEDELERFAWYEQNAQWRTHEVATREANPWGLYDVLGNVWEWVWDWHAEYPRGRWFRRRERTALTDPKGPASGTVRGERGGCWGSPCTYLRAAFRNYFDPMLRSHDLGFRPVRSELVVHSAAALSQSALG